MSRKQDAPLIEIGWLTAGRLDSIDREAVELARKEVQSFLEKILPEFTWRLPLLRRDELVTAARIEPVELLNTGVIERNIHHWDFSVIVTSADLVSHYKQDAIAVVSRSLEGAVISTVRIDPVSTNPDIDVQKRKQQLAHRVMTLALHSFGHFCGLSHVADTDNLMFDFETIDDVDDSLNLAESQLNGLRKDLLQVADQRLEESNSKRRNALGFYLRAAWINKSDILESLIESKPWQFPFRLSRLTTAAVSAILVLLISAEAWDLGMSQSPLFVICLSLVSVMFTTAYTLVRQKLFLRRERRLLSEQNVVTNVSTTAIVLVGMLTTYGLLLLLTATAVLTVFNNKLADTWSESIDAAPNATHYFGLCLFVSSLGILIGALGASFEQQTYFQHVTLVDEEI